MTGEIKVLNVGDGDAILVRLKKPADDLVMVIDGGHTSDYEDILKPELDKLLEKAGKNSPDIIVVTHYDSDHIGGIIPLVEEYINDIKEVWVHNPYKMPNTGKLLEEAGRLKDKEFLSKYWPSIKSYDIQHIVQEKMFLAIESLNQLKKLLDLIPQKKIKQVFSDYSLADWPEIKVIGPTRKYFNSVFKAVKDLDQFMYDEVNVFNKLMEEKQLNRKSDLEHIRNPCNFLRNENSAHITATNKASIIIAIDNNKKRYLFTGDAGIESFKAIPGWKKELKKIYWLKIPHHGSDNNLSKEIIDVMRPKYAVNSGNKYEDKAVLDCIAKNPRFTGPLQTTKEHGNITVKIE